MHYVNSLYHLVMDWTGTLSRTEWMLVMFVVLAAGCFFLRGFGSRKNA